MITNGVPATGLPGAEWRKPGYGIGNSNRAELARLGGGQIGIRQNTDPTGPALILDHAGLAGFIADVTAGGLDHLLLPA